jgi:hypothetical protein
MNPEVQTLRTAIYFGLRVEVNPPNGELGFDPFWGREVRG